MPVSRAVTGAAGREGAVLDCSGQGLIDRRQVGNREEAIRAVGQRALNAKLTKLQSGGDTVLSTSKSVRGAKAVGWTLKKNHNGKLGQQSTDLDQCWRQSSQGLG